MNTMSEKRLASSGDSFVDLTEMQIVDLLNKLSDENTRLHKKVDEQQATIDKVYELLEEADIFSDEATEHDIKAYIELLNFDNKDAYYLACAIKKAIKLLKGGNDE